MYGRLNKNILPFITFLLIIIPYSITQDIDWLIVSLFDFYVYINVVQISLKGHETFSYWRINVEQKHV